MDSCWPATDSWCHAGDRYLLKLFHDWLFHPTGGAAASPVLDWGRIVESLNKLDAGVSEQVSLMSRDEASLLVSKTQCQVSACQTMQALSTGIADRLLVACCKVKLVR